MAPTVALAAVVLLATWMGNVNGGYFVGQWSLAVFFTAVLLLVASVAGVFNIGQSRWSVLASGLLTAYAAWTLVSFYWSANQGEAWQGTGLVLLYLLVFLTTVAFITQGASRRWVFTVAALGPAAVAAFTVPRMLSNTEVLFEVNRLSGSVGYHNGEAAFLLVPFWLAMYLAGSRRVHPIIRSLVLAGATLSACLTVLTQSRGAVVAMGASALVFFLFSGQRLRGLLALVPVAVALLMTFPDLNAVYQAFVNEEDPVAALERVVPMLWLAAGGAAIYGLLWGVADRLWRPPTGLVRVAGALVLALGIVAVFFAASLFNERVGDPVAWPEKKWEAFKADDRSGQDQSRYLSASGSGRYTLWEVAWEDFAANPILGIGTQNYEATYYRLRDQSIGFVRQPHMLPLEVLSERGVVGGVLFFGFLATCLTAGLVQRFTRLNAEGKGQVGAAAAAVAYWFVHSSAEWFWQMPAVTLPAIVCLAVLVTPWQRETPEPSRWPLRVSGVLLAVLAVFLVGPLFIADYYMKQSNETENPWVGLQAIEQAQRFNPLEPSLAQREAELALKIGDWPRAEDAYSKAVELNPEHYAPHYLLGLFYEESGQREKALSMYRDAATLNPLDEDIDQHLKQLEAKTGKSS